MPGLVGCGDGGARFLVRWDVETVELGSWSGLIFYLKYHSACVADEVSINI